MNSYGNFCNFAALVVIFLFDFMNDSLYDSATGRSLLGDVCHG